jgi:nicotinamide mononucleotide transporter
MSRRLAAWLEANGHRVVSTREPTDGAFGRRYRAWARGEFEATPDQVLGFFLEDRREHLKGVVLPALARFEIVVCDRYKDSTLAYQAAQGLDRLRLRACSTRRVSAPTSCCGCACHRVGARAHGRGRDRALRARGVPRARRRGVRAARLEAIDASGSAEPSNARSARRARVVERASAVEWIGAAAGLACVWLVARANIWNWPVSILNTTLYFVVFLRARLYADALLQVVFSALGVYGWWSWRFGGAQGAELPIRRATRGETYVLLGASLAGTALSALVLVRATDSPAPIWDSSVLVLSLAATWAQARKVLESWWLWIGVDLISVPLYVVRELYPTALLYTLFLAICVVGLRRWTVFRGAAVVSCRARGAGRRRVHGQDDTRARPVRGARAPRRSVRPNALGTRVRARLHLREARARRRRRCAHGGARLDHGRLRRDRPRAEHARGARVARHRPVLICDTDTPRPRSGTSATGPRRDSRGGGGAGSSPRPSRSPCGSTTRRILSILTRSDRRRALPSQE